ncbi:hypothetical protein [Klebsiella pasteurii]|uniref:hypothetical protein n=1 Tax=Klebsiella pasteurii TaxID=2587529 RepID=UPI001157401D|nr:hypothetical protein [Klebsiella pasteurii]VUS25124.1 hypothetical protein SB6417_00088 [Klebsiella pasteurii]
MEFKDLPQKVQEIAAQCLADKISSTSGFGQGILKNEPVKEQARRVKEAFVELYSLPVAQPSLLTDDRELSDVTRDTYSSRSNTPGKT